MKAFTMRSALALASLFFLSDLPTAIAGDSVSKGCYKDSTPLEDKGPYTFQSVGYCQTECEKGSYAVYALYKGSNCFCGNELPSNSSKTSDDDCNTSCDGYPDQKCGGSDAYAVYLTGLKSDVSVYSSSSTSSGETTTTSNGQVVTSTDGTVVVTQTGKNDSDSGKKGGSNTAAIAAGVVVGTVGFAALVGAAFFLWRIKKRKSIEEQYRRTAAVDGFGKPMATNTMGDSRFDGEYMAQRRQSNGSIDENQDFSRRILQVTNPDRS